MSNHSGIQSILPLLPTPISVVHNPKHLQPPPSLTHEGTSAVILTGIRPTLVKPSTQVPPGHCIPIGVLVATVTAQKESQ